MASMILAIRTETEDVRAAIDLIRSASLTAKRAICRDLEANVDKWIETWVDGLCVHSTIAPYGLQQLAKHGLIPG